MPREQSAMIFASEIRPGDRIREVGREAMVVCVSSKPGAVRRIDIAGYHLNLDGFNVMVPAQKLVAFQDTMGVVRTYSADEELRRLDPLIVTVRPPAS